MPLRPRSVQYGQRRTTDTTAQASAEKAYSNNRYLAARLISVPRCSAPSQDQPISSRRSRGARLPNAVLPAIFPFCRSWARGDAKLIVCDQATSPHSGTMPIRTCR